MDEEESQFVAVFGRRRIGKTYLARESFERNFTFEHTGVSNESLDVNSRKLVQLEKFAESLSNYGYILLKNLPQNIDELFFKENALLANEYENLYRALFNKTDQYLKIVKALSDSKKGLTRDELIKKN